MLALLLALSADCTGLVPASLPSAVDASPAAAWQVRVTEVSPPGAFVSGPTVVAAASEPPGHGEFDVFAARDGALLFFLQGWIMPPFRNNQRIARWLDASGAPLTEWFLAI